MEHNDQLKKGFSQLKIESRLRSFFWGSSLGFTIGFIVFIIGIIITQNLLWIGLISALVISVLSGVLIYIRFLRPTVMKAAQRIDDLGLEERTITMVELSESDSFIAQIQRQSTDHILKQTPIQLFRFSTFTKPLLIFLFTLIFMSASFGFMILKVNAANADPNDPSEDVSLEDQILQKMIDDLLSIINNSQIDITLKNTLYGMVIDLSNRLPLYDTYIEKYTDVLETRNEILQLIADAIQDIEDSLMNIAEALQKYENTEVLGLAIATWNDDAIIEAFTYMYDRIAILLGQELYDVMWQTAIDIETALAEAVGTDPGMHEALQELADAYKLALDVYEPGNEEEVLALLQEGMDQSLQSLLDAIQALRDLIEELLELEEEIEEALEEVDQFPIFMPFPEEEGGDGDPGDPNNQQENTVIDGETPYTDVYDEYYQNAMEWLASEDISEEMRKIIENYFKMLS
jgi:tetratricopeptide (TPR) repeat protein